MRVENSYSANYREEIIKHITDSVKKGSCTAVVALRGSGLGPLVRFLHYHPTVKEKYFEKDDPYMFLFINIEELVNADEITLLKELLRELKTHLLEQGVGDESVIRTEFLRGIETVDAQEVVLRIKNLLEIVTEHDLKLAFIFQEFDEVARSNNPILTILYNLYFNYRPNLVYIFGIRSLPRDLRGSQETRFDYIFHNYIILKPFTYKEFEEHYSKLIKKQNLKVSQNELKIFYNFTGGLPAYIRMIENTFDLKNPSDLEDRLLEHIKNQQWFVVTKQLLAGLDPSEVTTLKNLAKNTGEISQKSLQKFKELGLINDNGKIFSKILLEDLTLLEHDDESGLVIDSFSKRIFVNNQEISLYLSAIEYKFLEFLYDHKGTICDREEIIQYAWGGNPDGISDEAIDQLVSRLRSKLLAKAGIQNIIKTIRGRGFTLE